MTPLGRLIRDLGDNNAYDILGVTSTASQAEIHRRYLALVRDTHPDNPDNRDRDSGRGIRLINLADDILESCRDGYDAHLRAISSGSADGPQEAQETSPGRDTESQRPSSLWDEPSPPGPGEPPPAPPRQTVWSYPSAYPWPTDPYYSAAYHEWQHPPPQEYAPPVSGRSSRPRVSPNSTMWSRLWARARPRTEIDDIIVAIAIVLMPPAGMLAHRYAERRRRDLARNDFQAADRARRLSRAWSMIGVAFGLPCVAIVFAVYVRVFPSSS
jgi:DnaJ domain